MSQKAQIVGKTFNRILVVKVVGRDKAYRLRVLARCHCGTRFETDAYRVTSGETLSCGCKRKASLRKMNSVHGHATNAGMTREYQTWLGMKARCYIPTVKNFKDYGGRGIRVCRRWKNSFLNFLKDMGQKPRGKSIERVDNDGNYTPKNCVWATRSQQNKNQRRWKNG